MLGIINAFAPGAPPRMEIALLVVLILLNGLFAMAEIALVTARRIRLQKMVDQGDRSAGLALALGEDPNRFLSTIQIGITLIGILNGIVGEAALAQPLARVLTRAGLTEQASAYGATAAVVIAITYFSIVLGELVPKRIGQTSPEPIARLVARPMLWLSTLGRPFVKLLATSTDWALKTLGIREQKGSGVTAEEIHALLEEGSESGAIEQQEHAMVRNVFRLDERQLASLMIPRADVVMLDIEDPIATNLAIIERAEHSRFPVCRGGWHEVLGIVTAKQLLGQALRGDTPDLIGSLQPAVFVPETLTGMELLEHFRASSGHVALVIDEYGEVQGLVTLQDLLEAITGEFTPHNVEDAWAVQRPDGSWLLDGLIPVPELKDHLGLAHVPEEERERYHTLSGMLMLLLGRVPQTGDAVDWEDWRFEIIDMDAKRIDKALATRGSGNHGNHGGHEACRNRDEMTVTQPGLSGFDSAPNPPGTRTHDSEPAHRPDDAAGREFQPPRPRP